MWQSSDHFYVEADGRTDKLGNQQLRTVFYFIRLFVVYSTKVEKSIRKKRCLKSLFNIPHFISSQIIISHR